MPSDQHWTMGGLGTLKCKSWGVGIVAGVCQTIVVRQGAGVKGCGEIAPAATCNRLTNKFAVWGPETILRCSAELYSQGQTYYEGQDQVGCLPTGTKVGDELRDNQKHPKRLRLKMCPRLGGSSDNQRCHEKQSREQPRPKPVWLLHSVKTSPAGKTLLLQTTTSTAIAHRGELSNPTW